MRFRKKLYQKSEDDMTDIINNMEFVRMFERRLSEYTGFAEAVCVDCCTNGILVALELYRREGRISKD